MAVSCYILLYADRNNFSGSFRKNLRSVFTHQKIVGIVETWTVFEVADSTSIVGRMNGKEYIFLQRFLVAERKQGKVDDIVCLAVNTETSLDVIAAFSHHFVVKTKNIFRNGAGLYRRNLYTE